MYPKYFLHNARFVCADFHLPNLLILECRRAAMHASSDLKWKQARTIHVIRDSIVGRSPTLQDEKIRGVKVGANETCII